MIHRVLISLSNWSISTTRLGPSNNNIFLRISTLALSLILCFLHGLILSLSHAEIGISRPESSGSGWWSIHMGWRLIHIHIIRPLHLTYQLYCSSHLYFILLLDKANTQVFLRYNWYATLETSITSTNELNILILIPTLQAALNPFETSQYVFYFFRKLLHVRYSIHNTMCFSPTKL